MKDKKLDVVLRARITVMLGTLNFYLNPDLTFTWRESSTLAAKAAGRSADYGRTMRRWLHQYLNTSQLPLHRYCHPHRSILDDEDLSETIHDHLMNIAKTGFIRAQDIVDFISSKDMQDKLGGRMSISERTAWRWLHKLDWQYKKLSNGMYIDGHEREDVVKYRCAFIDHWTEYEKRMVIYDNNGNVERIPQGFPIPGGRPFRLICNTQDESTFYAHDRRKTKWTHVSEHAKPVCKGEGSSLMVSDFLTIEWGRLQHGDQ